MDLNNIKVFISVIETGNFSSAGELLEMPSTSVSRKVQKLEEALGLRLLNRSTRNVAPTEEGKEYYLRCKQHLAGIEEANHIAMQLRNRPKGKVRITAPFDFSIYYLQSWINQFLNQEPDIQIELLAEDSYIDLIENRIDIAFRSGILSDSNLIARSIGPKHSVCCASPAYLQKHKTPRHPNELINHHCLILGKTLANQTWKFSHQDETVNTTIKGRYAANSMHLLCQAAIQDLGILYLPLPIVKQFIDSGELVWILEEYKSPISNMHIVYQSNKHLTAPVRMFIDFIIEQTRPTAPWVD
ncbi:LysR family transcriptional regulator [Flocculibacter collagenilyticus]|uniref:LysR family transcriptional regulator n=1 Tax=Flocculibacter collagenilyticus TaxID=2744479 RepID=UPI0018F31167|nr:LysR family transcriptional regulator [Flocculibacter collagenilyticus]